MPPEQLAQKVDTLETEKAKLELENAELRQQIEWFKRNVFGTGKSEKLDALQTRLGIDEPAPKEPEKQKVTYERKKGKNPRPSAEEQFEKLPVVETIELIPAAVQAEPERYKRIGEERTFEVDITPPKLFKREIVRPKFRCLDDRDAPPVIEPALPRPAVCSYASAGLMALMSFGVNTCTICRCIVRKRCPRTGVRNSLAKPWPTGSVMSRIGLSPFMDGCVNACSPEIIYRRMRLRSATWTPT